MFKIAYILKLPIKTAHTFSTAYVFKLPKTIAYIFKIAYILKLPIKIDYTFNTAYILKLPTKVFYMLNQPIEFQYCKLRPWRWMRNVTVKHGQGSPLPAADSVPLRSSFCTSARSGHSAAVLPVVSSNFWHVLRFLSSAVSSVLGA
jgi:hypothetical protein